MSDDTPEVRTEYAITVLRQKGRPIRAAYSYNVTPDLTLEGTVRIAREDVDPDTWAEIEFLKRCGILDVRPYVEPEQVAPDEAYTRQADETRAAIDAGEMDGAFPDTRKPNPPPPLLNVHDPIRTEKPDWEQAQREVREQLKRPEPKLHNAVTGEEEPKKKRGRPKKKRG